ncbi:MAG: NfeD family protein [Rhizobiales bacterium]|nr:NfeD family protein [Hyphomicrobiales bacterium]
MSSLASIIDGLGVWNWWVLAGILLVLEMLSASFFFLWLGAAAAIVGLIMFFATWSWQVQVSIFAVLAILLLVASRLWFKPGGDPNGRQLNRRAARLEGRIYRLEEAIENGRGKIKVGDTVWLVRGDNAPKGANVKVVGSEGTTLHIELTD